MCIWIAMLSACASFPRETSQNEVVALQGAPAAENTHVQSPPLKQETVVSDISKGTADAGNVQDPPSPASGTPVLNQGLIDANAKSASSRSCPLPVKHDLFPKRDISESSLVDNGRDVLKSLNSTEDENEKDIMEEALVLLDESQKNWARGELDDALVMLDQAYALLLNTNGNPDVARQKDDLRLIISKRILSIYNSLPTVAKGQRGEIPLISNPDVEKEIRSFQNYERDFFISSYYRSLIFRPIISAELKKAGMPDELSWLPLVESGYKINALSSARALGLWQFIPSTGYKYGLNRDDWVDERMDIEKSTRSAIAYLKDLHAMFGDWLTVLAGYNCGEGRVMRTIASQQINYLDRFWDLYQRLPNETARYVPRFIATLLIVKDPAKYGFDFSAQQCKYDVAAYDTVETVKSMRLHNIAEKLEIAEEHLSILNAELRHKATPNKPYRLKVPAGNAEKLLLAVAEIPDAEIPRVSYTTVRGVSIKHKVKKGETIASIAEKYKTSVNSIRSANKLSRKGLYVGQQLNIPITKASVRSEDGSQSAAKAAFHKVKKGDTLSKISKTYDVSIADLKEINNLKQNSLKVGQTVRLFRKEGDAGKKELAKKEGRSDKTAKGTAVKTYKVKKGDSLAKIAKKSGVNLKTLLTLNKMTAKDDVYPGQEIRVQ